MKDTVDRLSDGLDEAPWYVRAIGRFGVLTVLLLAFVYFVLGTTNQVMQKLAANNTQIIANQAHIIETEGQIVQHEERLAEILRDHAVASQQQTRFLLCSNLASSEAQRRECLQILVTVGGGTK